MPRCLDCKYFEHTEFTMTVGNGECLLGESEDGVPTHPETLAFAYDGDMYAATLLVRGDFGCVQFVAAEVAVPLPPINGGLVVLDVPKRTRI